MNLHARANARHRIACHLHAMRRGEERLDLEPSDINEMERAIEPLIPAFEKPGTPRYEIRVKHHGRKIVVVYDTMLTCIVTVLSAREV